MAPKIEKTVSKIAEYGLNFELGPIESRMKAHIGGKDDLTTNKFKPEALLSRWNEEATFKITLPDIDYKNINELFLDDKIELDAGSLIFRTYYKEVTIVGCPQMNVPDRTDQSLEFEIQFNNKPLNNYIELDIDFPDGLEFYKQTTPAGYHPNYSNTDPPDEIYVPDEVENSYAVYWNKRNNKYRTGKFCHIYRPKLTDAKQNSIWADIDINPQTKKMWITWDVDWMKSAVLPIVLDPTIGDTDESGGSTSVCSDYVWALELGTMSENGTVSTIHMYNAASSSIVGKLVAYEDTDADDEPEALVDYTVEIDCSGTGWISDNGTQGGSLTSGRIEYAGCWWEDGGSYQYDAVGGYTAHIDTTGYSDTTPPNPYGRLTGFNNRRASCYIDYTTGVAGNAPTGALDGPLCGCLDGPI